MTAVLLVQGRGEMAVLPAVTAVLLHHSAMDTWTDCSVVSTRERGKGASTCSSRYCYIIVLCICGLNVVLLVEGSGEMAFVPADALLHSFNLFV
jgi:hypothetical protein